MDIFYDFKIVFKGGSNSLLVPPEEREKLGRRGGVLTFSFPLNKSSILFRNTDEYGTNSKTDQKLKKGNYLETCYDWTPWNIKKLSQFRFVQLLIILKIANKLFPYLYSTMCKFIEKK